MCLRFRAASTSLAAWRVMLQTLGYRQLLEAGRGWRGPIAMSGDLLQASSRG
jgi:hypothetical protein